MYEYVDAHIHLYEFEEKEIGQLLKSKEFIFLAVSEDFYSSLKNIKLGILYENVIPAVGIHPWNADKISKNELENIKKLIEKENIKVLGEIGVDKKFVPNTFNRQKEIFEEFLKLAKEYDLSVNLHSPEAWKEVFELLLKYDIKKAYFHWYTGPLDLLKEIENVGYFVGINPAIFIQKKHQKVLENINIESILTESDAPYEYRNIYLHPEKIKELIKHISEVKNIDEKRVIRKIKENFSKFLA